MAYQVRILQSLLLASGLVLGAAEVHANPGATAAAPGSVPGGKDMRSRRGYLALSPGVIGVVLGGRSFPLQYIWGIEGGYHFPFGQSLMIQPGLVLEHSIFRQVEVGPPNAPYSLLAHQVRVGPQVRIGGGNAKAFGYALLSVAPGFIVADPYVFDEFVNRRARPTLNTTVGIGAQGLIIHKLLLGGEFGGDLAAGELVVRLRLYAGIMF